MSQRSPALVRGHSTAVTLATIVAVVLLVSLLLVPERRIAEADLVGRLHNPVPAELVLDASGPPAGARLLIAEQIRVRGTVELGHGSVLAANAIDFEPDSRIRVPSGALTVLGSAIRGGVFDVSGSPGADGAEPGTGGADGGSGGRLVLAGGQLHEVRIIADGGAAGQGASGESGQAGRNGRCGPDGFRMAERGEGGSDGGDGGRGGAGGVVLVWYGDHAPEITTAGGAAGVGARGGSGGRGGAGCDGVRGRQAAQVAGNEGKTGHVGVPGSQGSMLSNRVRFADLVPAARRWLDDGAESMDTLLDALRRVPIVE
jgi:hypothetical protein